MQTLSTQPTPFLTIFAYAATLYLMYYLFMGLIRLQRKILLDVPGRIIQLHIIGDEEAAYFGFVYLFAYLVVVIGLSAVFINHLPTINHFLLKFAGA